MHSSTVAIIAALLTTSYAQIGTVTLTSNPCPDTKYESKTFQVALNTVGVVQVDLDPLCGITLKSSSSVQPVTCQAFQDTAGKEVGSAQFTASKPALISTTPVTIKSLWCRNAQYNGASGSSSVEISALSTNTKTTGSIKTAELSLPTVTLGTPIQVSESASTRLAVPTGNTTLAGNPATFTGGARKMSAGAGAGVGLVGVAGVVALVL